MRKILQFASIMITLLALLPAHAQTTVTGSTIITGGGQTGNNLATYSHPGNVAGGVCYVSNFTITTDAFAAINACSAQLPAAGGTIDATALGTGTYTVTTPLTALNNASQAVTLILNSGTVFIINTVFPSPTNSPASCAVPVGGNVSQGSSIVVPGHSKSVGNFYLGPNFVGWDGVCNGNFQGLYESMLLDGVTVEALPGAQISGALMHLQGVFMPTLVENSGTVQCFAQCLEVDAAAGGSSTSAGNIMFLNDLFTDGYTGSTVYPGSVVKIDALSSAGEVTNVIFLGGAIQDNGPHNPLLIVNGRGGGQTGALSFLNTYFETAAATTSSFNSNVDPVQLSDVGQVVIDPMRVQGAINPAAQANLVDISGTGTGASFGINLSQVSVFTAAGFTRIINNTIEGTTETGYPNGSGSTALPNYEYGQVVPQVRQTNTPPPTTPGQCVIGSLWTDSSASTAATTVYVCAGNPGNQTYQAIGAGGGGGGGNVNNGNAQQITAYPAAGNTVGPAPGLFALTPTMTLAQTNALFSSLAVSGGTVLIPDGTPQTNWQNTSVQTKDLRKFADYLQVSRYGAVCDEQAMPFNVTLTAGSPLVFVGGLNGAAQDVGKTMTFAKQTGFLYNSPQVSWTPTILSFSSGNFTLSSNAPFNFTGVAQLGTLNTTALQAALTDAGSVFPLSIPSGCKMLTDTLHWNNAQSIIGRQMQRSGFVGMPGHPILIQPDGARITSWAISGNVATFQTPAGNDFVPTDPITISGFPTSTFLNGVQGTVLSAGLSTTQFAFSFIHANGTATESGVAAPGRATGTGVRLENLGFVLDAGVDPSQVTGGQWTSYDAAGTPTVQPAVYYPLYDHSPLAANPLAPGFLTGGKNGVAATTQNSAVVCTPNAYAAPVVGQTIMFPYFTSIFTATVSSTAGSCSAGFTARTMSAALPNVAGYTQTQAEWFTGSAIQSTTTTIPTTITYPLTLTLTLSTSPVPGWESNFPQHGHIKVCGIEADFMGGSQLSPYTIVLRRGPTATAGCSGTTPIAPLNPCPAKNLFGSNSDQPWPVIPSINAGDSTPSGANWFPGECGGAAAIGFPEANGNVFVNTGLSNAFLENLEFDTTGVQLTNQTMPMYFAGNLPTYGTDIGGIKSNYLWGGIMQGPASSGQHGVGPVGPTSAGNTLHNLSIRAAFPMTFVDFQQSKIDRADTYSTEISPFDGTAVGTATCLHFGYTLSEQTGAGITFSNQEKITEWNCEPENGSHIEVNPYFVSDGNAMTFDTDNFEALPNYFGGSQQTVSNSQLGLPTLNYGNNNVFENLANSNAGYYTNIWDGHPQFLNWGTNSKCNFFAGGQGPSVACGSGFVQPFSGHSIESSVTGNTTHPYENSLGGMITPGEWNTSFGLDSAPMSVAYVADPTEPFWGSYAGCNLNAGGAQCQPAHFDGLNGFVFVGPHNRVADGPYVLTFDMKSAAASSTVVVQVVVEDSGSGQCANPAFPLATTTISTTTSWQNYSLPVDFTTRAGCAIAPHFFSASTTDQFRVGYFNFVPVPQWQLLPVASPTVGAACPVSGAILGLDSTKLYACAANLVTAIPFSSTGAITALTGDVTAAGPGSVAASVVAIGGGSLNFTGLVQDTAGVFSQANSFNLTGSGQVGTSFAAGLDTVTFSATPVFNATVGNTHYLQLTGTVTSSSFTAGPPNATQQFKICQDGTGGRAFVWPTNFAGFPAVTLAANGCTTAIGWYDSSTVTVWGDQYNTAQCVSAAISNVPCGAATRGYFAVPAGTNSALAVLTTAMGTSSGLFLNHASGAAAILGTTCATASPSGGVDYVWTPGTSFTVTTYGTTAGNQCYFWSIVNP